MGWYDQAKEDRSLAHHGIKGQKWGVRRFQDYDGTRIKSGSSKSKSNKKVHDFQDYSKSNRSAKTDLVLSTIAGYGMTAVSAIANVATISSGYVIPQVALLTPVAAITSVAGTAAIISGDIAEHKANKKEKKFAEERAQNPVDKKTGFHKKTKDMTPEEDMERVNPGYMNWDANTKNNCVLCTMSYELRRRGYDVQAQKATQGYSEELVKDWYTGSKIKRSEGSLSDADAINNAIHGYPMNATQKSAMITNTVHEIEKQPKGARGMLSVTWDRTTSGHALSYANENGKMVLYDTQANERYEGEAAKNYLERCSQIGVIRLDNCKINNKYIKEVAS